MGFVIHPISCHKEFGRGEGGGAPSFVPFYSIVPNSETKWSKREPPCLCMKKCAFCVMNLEPHTSQFDYLMFNASIEVASDTKTIGGYHPEGTFHFLS